MRPGKVTRPGRPAIARARLTIDLDAVAANWRALDALSGAAGRDRRRGQGRRLRPRRRPRRPRPRRRRRPQLLRRPRRGGRRPARGRSGPAPAIYVFAGLMPGDAPLCREFDLIPCLNSAAQMQAFARDLPGRPCALQLDSGMNRLGLEPAELAASAHLLPAPRPGPRHQPPRLRRRPRPPDEPPPRPRPSPPSPPACPACASASPPPAASCSAPAFHFGLTRPGDRPLRRPALRRRPPGRQPCRCRSSRSATSPPARAVGYGAAWTAPAPARVATVAAGYADGLLRALGQGDVSLFAGDTPCPLVGRVSMDLITVDVSALAAGPRPPRNPQRPPDRRRPRHGRRHHRLRDPDQPWRALRARLQGGRPAPGTCMILLRLAYGLPRLDRPLHPGAPRRHRPADASSPSRPSPSSSARPSTRCEFGQQLLRIGYFSLPVVGLTTLFTGAALALQI